MENTKAPAVIQSLQAGLKILELMGREKVPLKFTDIQRLSGMTKSNLYKYLNTLCLSGMIFRNPSTNTYVLGQKLIELGTTAMGNNDLVEHAAPYIKKIIEETKLTALLAIPSPNGPLITQIWSPEYGINIGAQIGTNLPLTSSTGLVFSAFGKSSDLKNWEKISLQKLSIDELKSFQIEVVQTQETYFASKIEPLIEHVSSFSVPILNFKEDLIGAITVVSFTELVPKTSNHKISQFVLGIAKELSVEHGFFKK